LALFSALVLASCSDSASTAPVANEPALRTVPADGATNVDPSAPIAMAFDEPMDTIEFHQWFYCLDSASHDALEDSLHNGWMGMGMGHHEDDTAAFYERMHDRMMDGDFDWFGNADSCEFHPGSPFEPNTEYVMHFRHDMQTAHGGHMQHMGHVMDEDWAIRFRTGE